MPGGATTSREPARVTVPPTVREAPGIASKRPVLLMVRLPVVIPDPCGANVPVLAVILLASEPLRISFPAVTVVGPV